MRHPRGTDLATDDRGRLARLVGAVGGRAVRRRRHRADRDLEEQDPAFETHVEQALRIAHARPDLRVVAAPDRHRVARP